jgi:predicted transcriptional regulator
MLTQKDFVQIVDGYLSRTGMAPSTFSKQVVGDPTFVSCIRRGRAPRITTVKRVLEFIEGHDNDP